MIFASKSLCYDGKDGKKTESMEIILALHHFGSSVLAPLSPVGIRDEVPSVARSFRIIQFSIAHPSQRL